MRRRDSRGRAAYSERNDMTAMIAIGGAVFRRTSVWFAPSLPSRDLSSSWLLQGKGKR